MQPVSSNSPDAPPAGVSRAYSWAVVGMLWFICFFNYADRQAIFSVFPLLEKEFSFTKEQLGIIGAAFTWTYALLAPFAGSVSDRLPRKAVILGGLYVWSAITGFTAICSRVWHFVVVRAAEGLGETFYFPASMSLISDYHGKATRSRAMSLHQTSVYAGTIGGGALAGWLGEVYGWEWPFILLAVAGILLGLALAAFIREPARDEAERASAQPIVEEAEPLPTALTKQGEQPVNLTWIQFLGEMMRTPTALALVLAFFGANFVGVIFLVWMPTFLTEEFSMSLTGAGINSTVYLQIASMVGAIVGGMLADAWRARHPGGRILVQATGVLLGAPTIYLCGFTTNMYALFAALSCVGFAKGLYDSNIWASLFDVVPTSRRASAVGLMNMIGWLGGGFGSIMVGVAVDRWGFTLRTAIASTAAIYAAVAVILILNALLFAPRDVRKAAALSAGATVV